MTTRPFSRCFDVLVLCACLLLAAERPLFAYIDPGSGALLWQAVVAGFVGVAYYFRRFWKRVIPKRRRDDRTPGDPT